MLLPSRPCSRAVCTLEPPQPPESRARQSSCYTRKQIEVVNQDLEAAVGRLEGEWMKLAQEYRASGNLPFAVRALYLSSLAILADGGLLTLARGKSNLDYSRELERRTKRLAPDFLSLFRQNVGLFEQTWYGTHPLTGEALDLFERNSSALRDYILARQ